MSNAPTFGAGVFEVLAADQSQQVVAGRKAVALATQRVNDRFSRFLLAAESRDDLHARLSLVIDDLKDVVAQTCDEVGHGDAKPLVAAITNSYTRHPRLDALDERDFGPVTAENGVKVAAMQFESRRPKMCPYHKEVVDISLSSGEAKAGYEAMASHAWGPNHCDGEYEGGCNFRREMVTQSWWDDREKALQERREQREQERAEQAESDQVQPTELEQAEEPVSDDLSDSEAPTTETEVSLGDDPGSAAEGLTEAPEGVDGVEAEVPMAMAASFHRHAEALKTRDVQQRPGPSPKIDKRKWTIENLQQRVKTEDEGSPHPTKEKDVVVPIRAENGGRHDPSKLEEIGGPTTEKQDVSKDSGPKPTNRRTWPTGERSAVSSAPDVDKNPLAEILKADDGFVPESIVHAARARV